MKTKPVLYSFALAAIASFAFVETGSAQVTVVEEEVTVTELIPGKPYYYAPIQLCACLSPSVPLPMY